jgi:hypothetical protein
MDSGLPHQDTIERHRYLEVLHQFRMSQASLTSVDDICWNIAKTAIGDLGFIDCVIYLINDRGERLSSGRRTVRRIHRSARFSTQLKFPWVVALWARSPRRANSSLLMTHAQILATYWTMISGAQNWRSYFA